MDSVIEILILCALALPAQDDGGGASAEIERALALAAPEGYVRVLVDEGAPIAALLQAFSLQPSASDLRPIHRALTRSLAQYWSE